MRRSILLLFLITQYSVFPQVGIGTTDPHPDVMVDINGALRVRGYVEGSENAARDSIAVFDGRGVLESIPTRMLLANMDKSLVKAKLNSNFTIALLSNVTIKFDSEDFDIKDEFDPSTGYFTAEYAGIYRVSAQIKSSSLSAGDLGLSIYKTNAAGTIDTKIAEEKFINVSVLGINVSPPVRSVSTLVQLQAGEKISFKVYSAVGLSLSGTSSGYDSFCTIEQVR
ncbi:MULTISPECIES: hypothetical protein [unclassified Leeuwenhoekiella]|mgnify:CR=1 FL=1|uniref:C1q-like domain-containing protein n=1 Tax=unclassified Leeuwenhoekiella TaxID=2615029 RepID=UPI000C66C475|nr:MULTISPECIES: hypothetical protein [unclassified Leeuwenhoekiella]MAW95334.1 hypothetical protein [Leeuwenhoekiella sp.]MBA81742.1 hypothetical protein [Leeuwenhoekiella sp.]|tara:strand:+ start:10384 stop:11058 length:675 start_codon:yes stop_codon:yes gene_type:complete